MTYLHQFACIRQACSFKYEKLRGKQAKFMTKELRKAIMD